LIDRVPSLLAQNQLHYDFSWCVSRTLRTKDRLDLRYFGPTIWHRIVSSAEVSWVRSVSKPAMCCI